MSDIEHLIANVLIAHTSTPFGCLCGYDEWAWTDHVAEVMAAELGLTRETRPRGAYRGSDPKLKWEQSRYVTEWVLE